MLVTVYLPTPRSTALAHLIPGSGLVGLPPAPHALVAVVYYEGNKYGAGNLHHYHERVACAAGRLMTHYPTVARAVVPTDQLIAVGTYDWDTHLLWLEPSQRAAVEIWRTAYSPQQPIA